MKKLTERERDSGTLLYLIIVCEQEIKLNSVLGLR